MAAALFSSFFPPFLFFSLSPGHNLMLFKTSYVCPIMLRALVSSFLYDYSNMAAGFAVCRPTGALARRRNYFVNSQGNNDPEERSIKSAPPSAFNAKAFLESVSAEYLHPEIPEGLSELTPPPKYSPQFTDLLMRYLDPNITEKKDPENLGSKTTRFINIGCDPDEPSDADPLAGIIIERWFYPELFAAVRNGEKGKIMLTGNAGTGKSYFEHYYMYRIIQAVHRGLPLPPDPWGSTAAPNVVVREMGRTRPVIFFIKELRAFTAKWKNIEEVLCAFENRTNLHLIEPNQVLFDAPNPNTKITTFKANSMDEKYGIKEFEKSHLCYVMPIYELWELLLVGEVFRAALNDTDDRLSLFAERDIRNRFEKYNGIIRHVLPSSKAIEKDVEAKQNNAIQNCSSKVLHLYKLDGLPDVSNNLAVVIVKKDGENAFRKSGMRIMLANKSIQNMVLEKNAERTMSTLRNWLMAQDRKIDDIGEAQLIEYDRRNYEYYFMASLRKGIQWELREVNPETNSTRNTIRKPFVLKIKEKSIGVVLIYSLMTPEVVYMPEIPNFVIADVLLKRTNSDLYIFNMKTGVTALNVKIDAVEFKRLLNVLSMTDIEARDRLHYVVVALHSTADEYKITLDTTVHFKSTGVLKPGKSYERKTSQV